MPTDAHGRNLVMCPCPPPHMLHMRGQLPRGYPTYPLALLSNNFSHKIRAQWSRPFLYSCFYGYDLWEQKGGGIQWFKLWLCFTCRGVVHWRSKFNLLAVGPGMHFTSGVFCFLHAAVLFGGAGESRSSSVAQKVTWRESSFISGRFPVVLKAWCFVLHLTSEIEWLLVHF